MNKKRKIILSIILLILILSTIGIIYYKKVYSKNNNVNDNITWYEEKINYNLDYLQSLMIKGNYVRNKELQLNLIIPKDGPTHDNNLTSKYKNGTIELKFEISADKSVNYFITSAKDSDGKEYLDEKEYDYGSINLNNEKAKYIGTNSYDTTNEFTIFILTEEGNVYIKEIYGPITDYYVESTMNSFVQFEKHTFSDKIIEIVYPSQKNELFLKTENNETIELYTRKNKNEIQPYLEFIRTTTYRKKIDEDSQYVMSSIILLYDDGSIQFADKFFSKDNQPLEETAFAVRYASSDNKFITNNDGEKIIVRKMFWETSYNAQNSSLYVIDINGYLYEKMISGKFNAMEKHSNKKVVSISKDYQNNKLKVTYEDDTEEIFNNIKSEDIYPYN